MESLTEEAMKCYIMNKVDPRKTLLSKIVEEVQYVIHKLTKEISYKDIRFQDIPNSVYHNENLKVLAPTLFVMTVPIKGLLGYKKDQTRRWRYYSVSGSRLFSPIRDPEEIYQWLEVDQFLKTLRQWHETDVTMDGDIMPAKVVEVFMKLVEDSITSCNLSGEISILDSTGPCVRLMVETSEFQVEVELIPVVEIRNRWCDKARWPRWFSRWPSREKVEYVKTILFWTCEKYPRSKDWSIFKKAFLRLVRKLYKCVNQSYLKHFFVKNTNMFQYSSKNDLDSVAQKLNLFLKNPVLQ
ncbi:protein mab-21-like 3 isoform X2 [Petaurus breviceps papuanus]|uniref:protein mab-21-like 3 isoform X2 n=1 Tax=Petaurus breviceps papuanus TaxID=3040969 RepID=UPI0036DC6B1D